MVENNNGDLPGGSEGHVPPPPAQDGGSVPPPPVQNAGAPAPEKKSDTVGIIGLIAGIIAVLCSCCGPVGIVLGLAALICGIIAKSNGQRFAIAGIILGIVALVFSILFLVLGSAISLYLPDFMEELIYQFEYY